MIELPLMRIHKCHESPVRLNLPQTLAILQVHGKTLVEVNYVHALELVHITSFDEWNLSLATACVLIQAIRNWSYKALATTP